MKTINELNIDLFISPNLNHLEYIIISYLLIHRYQYIIIYIYIQFYCISLIIVKIYVIEPGLYKLK